MRMRPENWLQARSIPSDGLTVKGYEATLTYIVAYAELERQPIQENAAGLLP